MTRNAFFVRACHVFTLCGFAFAQPLLDLVAGEPAFLVVHRAGLVDVLALISILCLLVPAAFVGLEVAVRAVGTNAEKWTHYGTIAFLVAVVALPALKGTDWSGILLLGLSSAIGLGVAVSYASSAGVRLFLTFLSPAILLFPAIFVFRPATAPVLFPRTSVAGHSSTGANTQISPVVIVVFDELPLTSLLDEHYQIDAARYPHFAELAQNATWFRSAVTVDDRTVVAVPTIFSGTEPRPDALPIYEHYPDNVFTLLQKTHELHVFESLTKLCPETLCPEAHQRSLGRRLASMISDLSLVYLHLVLPQEYSTHLPAVTQTWKDFDGGMLLKKASRSFDDRAATFSSFVASIKPTAKPGVHAIHTLLPHVPWEYFPSGVVYTRSGMNVPGLSFDTETWSSDTALVAQGYRRHLRQVQLVDNLIGELLMRLRAANMYDRSLIVVTADHGASFWPGAPRRSGSEKSSEFFDVRRVPLFIKAPFQNTGTVRDRQASVMDIVPTIADILRIGLPEPLDGRSLWSPDPNTAATGSSVLATLRPSLERKLTLFGSPSHSQTKGRAVAVPYQWLRGTSIEQLPIAASPSHHAALDLTEESFVVEAPAQFVPGHITGRLTDSIALTDNDSALAVAINGTIQDVMPFYDGPRQEPEFSLLVPEGAFHPGPNELELFVVSGHDTTLRLEPVSHSWLPE